MVLADEEGVYAAPAAGKLKALYGLAAGTSDKYWELGGYTGSAALATGYAWVKIDGTLYKLLDRDAADVRYAAFPAGVLTAYGGASPPSGWLFCDGAAVSRSTYAALFAAIGTTYGGRGWLDHFQPARVAAEVPARQGGKRHPGRGGWRRDTYAREPCGAESQRRGGGGSCGVDAHGCGGDGALDGNEQIRDGRGHRGHDGDAHGDAAGATCGAELTR